MLVLSRQRDETIMIGDDIEITVVDIRGDKVRLGITAPTCIAVHRKEVYEAIKAENMQASQMDNGDIDVLARAISPGPQRKGGAERLGGVVQRPAEEGGGGEKPGEAAGRRRPA